jgi:hypothetical protein
VRMTVFQPPDQCREFVVEAFVASWQSLRDLFVRVPTPYVEIRSAARWSLRVGFSPIECSEENGQCTANS